MIASRPTSTLYKIFSFFLSYRGLGIVTSKHIRSSLCTSKRCTLGHNLGRGGFSEEAFLPWGLEAEILGAELGPGSTHPIFPSSPSRKEVCDTTFRNKQSESQLSYLQAEGFGFRALCIWLVSLLLPLPRKTWGRNSVSLTRGSETALLSCSGDTQLQDIYLFICGGRRSCMHLSRKSCPSPLWTQCQTASCSASASIIHKPCGFNQSNVLAHTGNHNLTSLSAKVQTSLLPFSDSHVCYL